MQLKYGTDYVTFTPDAGVAWTVLPEQEPGDFAVTGRALIDKAVADLLLQLRDTGVASGSRLLLVVPDHTRRCRLAEILGALLPVLVKNLNPVIKIIVANGSHVLQPEAVVRELVGESVYDHFPVIQHDARDDAQLIELGVTSYGTPVRLNKLVLESDWIITIGGILYHYFAGFGGGPKMLLPGIAGVETIRSNHRRTLDPQTGMFHRDCEEGNILTNPVFVDLAQVVNFVPRVLSLQVVLSPRGEIVDAEAGPLLPVHQRLCERVRQLYGVPVKEKADVVVVSAGGYPADVNLIQSHKSIHHAFQALKPGGAVIALAECREGIGSSYFMRYFNGATSAQMGARLLSDYQINGHTALALRTKTESARIILVSKLDANEVQQTGMCPAASFTEAWEIAKNHLPASAMGYIMPNGSKYAPVKQN